MLPIRKTRSNRRTEMQAMGAIACIMVFGPCFESWSKYHIRSLCPKTGCVFRTATTPKATPKLTGLLTLKASASATISIIRRSTDSIIRRCERRRVTIGEQICDTISRWHFARNVLIPNPLGIAQLSPKSLTVKETHLTFNQGVVGSSPTALTNLIKYLRGNCRRSDRAFHFG